uniref:Uncharacterized protein n=1 Tax=Oryza glumipatula TaxID=40148 RepID=A0A0E0AGM9_9ORYZ
MHKEFHRRVSFFRKSPNRRVCGRRRRRAAEDGGHEQFVFNGFTGANLWHGNVNATNHLFAIEFDTILNSEFNDISGTLSAGGGGQAELQKGARKKACSCGSLQRQGQPGGGRAA